MDQQSNVDCARPENFRDQASGHRLGESERTGADRDDRHHPEQSGWTGPDRCSQQLWTLRGPLRDTAGRAIGVDAGGLLEAPNIDIAMPVRQLSDSLFNC